MECRIWQMEAMKTPGNFLPPTSPNVHITPTTFHKPWVYSENCFHRKLCSRSAAGTATRRTIIARDIIPCFSHHHLLLVISTVHSFLTLLEFPHHKLSTPPSSISTPRLTYDVFQLFIPYHSNHSTCGLCSVSRSRSRSKTQSCSYPR